MNWKKFQCPFVKCRFKSHSLLLVEIHMVEKHNIRWEKIELENHTEQE